jgi:hypothetical protein
VTIPSYEEASAVFKAEGIRAIFRPFFTPVFGEGRAEMVDYRGGILASRREVAAIIYACLSHLHEYATEEQIEAENAQIEKQREANTLRAIKESSEAARRELERKRAGYVYLMRNNRNGYVKIGFSRNPKHREKTLQSEDPDVELLWSHQGFKYDERELHARYASMRVRGEWFRLTADDVAHIIANMNTL